MKINPLILQYFIRLYHVSKITISCVCGFFARFCVSLIRGLFLLLNDPAPKKKSALLSEQRHYERYSSGRPILISPPLINQTAEDPTCIIASMKDYSRGGICFETNYFFQPGTCFDIRFDNGSLASSANEPTGIYHAVSKWCQEDLNSDITFYMVGAQYYRS